MKVAFFRKFTSVDSESITYGDTPEKVVDYLSYDEIIRVLESGAPLIDELFGHEMVAVIKDGDSVTYAEWDYIRQRLDFFHDDEVSPELTNF